jgi:hypothetical protein
VSAYAAPRLASGAETAATSCEPQSITDLTRPTSRATVRRVKRAELEPRLREAASDLLGGQPIPGGFLAVE